MGVAHNGHRASEWSQMLPTSMASWSKMINILVPLSTVGYMPGGELTVSKQHQTTIKTDHVKINCNKVKLQDNELIKVLSNNRSKLCEISS